jgi:lipid-A-disaccharide synthase
LPNLLADDALVREFIQDEVTTESLGGGVMELIDNPALAEHLTSIFGGIHDELRRDASRVAADVVLQMTGRADGS